MKFHFLCAETVVYGHGETVRLSCKTSLRNCIQWNYHHRIGGPSVGVYKNGQIDESYKRFSVDYLLIIRNATAKDEGYYSCVESAGSGRETSRYRLRCKGIVLCHIFWKYNFLTTQSYDREVRCQVISCLRAMTHTAINCGNIMAQLSCAIILPVCHSYLR